MKKEEFDLVDLFAFYSMTQRIEKEIDNLNFGKVKEMIDFLEPYRRKYGEADSNNSRIAYLWETLMSYFKEQNYGDIKDLIKSWKRYIDEEKLFEVSK